MNGLEQYILERRRWKKIHRKYLQLQEDAENREKESITRTGADTID
jgi:hypothetical protein